MCDEYSVLMQELGNKTVHTFDFKGTDFVKVFNKILIHDVVVQIIETVSDTGNVYYVWILEATLMVNCLMITENETFLRNVMLSLMSYITLQLIFETQNNFQGHGSSFSKKYDMF